MFQSIPYSSTDIDFLITYMILIAYGTHKAVLIMTDDYCSGGKQICDTKIPGQREPIAVYHCSPSDEE